MCRILESECITENPGYKWIAGKCYFFDATRKTFEDAADNCENMFKFGGKLVEPRSLQLRNSLYEVSKTVTGKSYRYWLGIGFSEARNDFVYISDKKLVTIDAWCKTSSCLSSPSSYFERTETGGYGGSWNSNGWFHSVKRTSTLPYICESL